MGRTASGVRGINMDENDRCIGAEAINDDDTILIVTEKGFGKQARTSDFRTTKRGSKGVKALNITEKNGKFVSFKISMPDQDVIIITNQGMVIRIPINQINVLNRATQGVRLINLKDDQLISTMSVVSQEDVSHETYEE